MPSVANTSDWRSIEPFHQKAPQVLRHRGIDREHNDVSAAAALQSRFKMADEILGFLFELDFAVAQYPEYALGHDRKTGKQVIEEQGNHLLDRQKPNWLTGQPNETMDRGRDQGKRLQSLAVTYPFQLQHQAEAAIGDKREWMRGIDGQRGQAPERPRP